MSIYTPTRISADSIELGQWIDLDQGEQPAGEPRQVSSTRESGIMVYVEFADGEPGASFGFDELVWQVPDPATVPNQFTLTIRLGNDLMQTPEDVARELHAVADQLADPGPHDTGTISEPNGHTVGRFEFGRATDAEGQGRR